MQEGVRVQRHRCGAPGVRRGATTAGRPAREHLPVAHKVGPCEARATESSRFLGRHAHTMLIKFCIMRDCVL